MFLFSASVSYFKGMLMDYCDASWLVQVILPYVLSITSPSGHLTSPCFTHLFPCLVTWGTCVKALLLLIFISFCCLCLLCHKLVAQETIVLSKVEDAVLQNSSDWHSISITRLRVRKEGEEQRKLIHFHAPETKYI